MTVTRLVTAALTAAIAATLATRLDIDRPAAADRAAHPDHHRAGRPRTKQPPAWSTSRSAATTSARRSNRPGRRVLRSSRSRSRTSSQAHAVTISGPQTAATRLTAFARFLPAITGCSPSSTSTRGSRAQTENGLAAHGSMGRPELEALAREPLWRSGAGQFDPPSTTPITLVADKVIPPISRRRIPSSSSASRSKARS